MFRYVYHFLILLPQQYILLNLAPQLYDQYESGLLGMEIHPDFNNGAPYVFMAYTYNYAVGAGDGTYGRAAYYPLPGFNTLFKISKEF